MKKYKWAKPKNSLEKIERLYLTEDRGDRVLITSNFTESCGSICPTYCVQKSELIELPED